MSVPPSAVLDILSRGSNFRGATPSAVTESALSQPLRAALSEEDHKLAALVMRMRLRDQAALAQLFDLTASRLHAVALRIARNPATAEEVLSETYYQAWRDCARYDAARGKVLAWLMIICRSRALDALRRQDEAFSHPDPHELNDLSALSSPGDDPAEMLDLLRGNERVQVALRALSAVQRQLVALAFFKGLSHAEIAAHQDMPLGTVKTHIRKALAVLRETLGADDPNGAIMDLEADA